MSGSGEGPLVRRRSCHRVVVTTQQWLINSCFGQQLLIFVDAATAMVVEFVMQMNLDPCLSQAEQGAERVSRTKKGEKTGRHVFGLFFASLR